MYCFNIMLYWYPRRIKIQHSVDVIRKLGVSMMEINTAIWTVWKVQEILYAQIKYFCKIV